MSDETESDVDPAGPFARRKRPLRRAMGAVYVIAGLAHFAAPSAFVLDSSFERVLTAGFGEFIRYWSSVS